MPDESGWLIEAVSTIDDHSLGYLAVLETGGFFVVPADGALRFARKVDAEAIMRVLCQSRTLAREWPTATWRSSEHSWPAPELQAGAPVLVKESASGVPDQTCRVGGCGVAEGYKPGSVGASIVSDDRKPVPVPPGFIAVTFKNGLPGFIRADHIVAFDVGPEYRGIRIASDDELYLVQDSLESLCLALGASPTVKEPKPDYDAVHAEHCCVVHGCKYGDERDCPVANGKLAQIQACEQCIREDITMDDIIKALRVSINCTFWSCRCGWKGECVSIRAFSDGGECASCPSCHRPLAISIQKG